jgi:hypothetical protein
MSPYTSVPDFQYTRLVPQAAQFAQLVNLNLATPRSFELFRQLHQPNVVSEFNTQALLSAYPGRESYQLIAFPVKVPGSPYFMPKWLVQTGIPQAIVNHHQASSSYAPDDSLLLTYERLNLRAGATARLGSWGIHVDDLEARFIKNIGRTITCYLAVTGAPTVFYDGFTADLTCEKVSRLATIQSSMTEPSDYDDATQYADQIYRPCVTPAFGYCFRPGTLVCFNGLTPHDVSRMPQAGPRALVQMYTADGALSETQIQRNTALYAWYKKHLALAA